MLTQTNLEHKNSLVSQLQRKELVRRVCASPPQAVSDENCF